MTLSLALRVCAVLAATLLAALAAPRAPAAARRDILTLGAVAACLLPPLRALPSLPVPSLPAGPVAAGAPEAASGAWVTLQEPAVVAAHAVPWLAALWAVGAAVVLARVVVGAWQVHRLRRGAVAIDAAWAAAVDVVGSSVPVRAHPGLTSPMVVGWLRPEVLVPTEPRWDLPRRVRALRHELAHVAARDPLRVLLAHALCAAHWFDPLAWALASRLRLEQERAADEAVIRSGTAAADYAHDLVDLARAVTAAGPLAVRLGGSPLERRVRSLLGGVPAARLPAPLGWALAGGVVGTALIAGTLGAPAVAGPPADVQALVDAEARALEAAWHPEAVAIVVVDARTGLVAARSGATERGWASGSVVKPFVAVAALDAGAAGDRGELGHLLEVSSNDGFVALATTVGTASLAPSLRAQGLSGAADLAPAELALGQFPATTAELAVAYAHLGDTANGRVVRDLLTRVVEGDEGTGRQAAVAGARVAGKTGTSLLSPGDAPDRVLASFAGLIPADSPRWAVVVQVAGPTPTGWGGSVAAPAFAHLAAALPAP